VFLYSSCAPGIVRVSVSFSFYDSLLKTVDLLRQMLYMWAPASIVNDLACIASVSMGLEAKKDGGTGFSVFCLRGKWGESQKKERGG